MSGRFVLGSCHRFGPFPLLALSACLAPFFSATPALAQSAADAPEAPSAPAAPPVAPPEPAPPAPVPPSETPPSAAPPITEPAPAAPALPPEGVAPQPELPAGSAAFAPLPAESSEAAEPKPTESSPPPADAPSAPPKPVSHAVYNPSSKDEDSGGLLGPIRIGVLVGTGLPEVANFGAQLKLTRFIGLGVNVGLIPTVKIRYYGEAAQAYQEYDAYGHIYPFGGSFFLGAGVGYVKIDGTLLNRFNLADLQQPGISGSVDVTSNASVRTLVLTPQLGFLKIFDVGFAIGFDLGAQIPIASSQVEFNTVAPGVPPVLADSVRTKYINPNDEKVRRTLNTVGRTPLPTFNFKIGWFL
ncbi:MAG: hypothetical protein WDO74_31945 [Pseudomonadota bacterium]